MSAEQAGSGLQEARDRAMHVLLEESAGGLAAPDLRDRLEELELQRGTSAPANRRARWLMAAVLLLGAGIVTVLAFGDAGPGETDGSPAAVDEAGVDETGADDAAVADTEQDSATGDPIEVESLSQLLELFEQARGVRLRVDADRSVELKRAVWIGREPDVADVAPLANDVEIGPSIRALARRGLRPRTRLPVDVEHALEVVVDSAGNFVRCRVDPTEPVLAVGGLGVFTLSSVDHDALRRLVVERGRQMRWQAGHLFGDELRRRAAAGSWAAAARAAADPRAEAGTLHLHELGREHLALLGGELFGDRIRRLDLSPSANTLPRGSLVDLPMLPNLRSLELRGVFVKAGELGTLTKQPALLELDLLGMHDANDPSSTRLTKEIFQLLLDSRIERLNLAATGIADPLVMPYEVSPVVPARPVRSLDLDLRGTHFGRATQEFLLGITGGDPDQPDARIRLRRLSVAGCSKVGAEWLERVAKSSPGLESLDVRLCEGLRGQPEGMARVVEQLPALRELRLRDQPMSPQLVGALAEHAAELRSLEWSFSGTVVAAVEGNPYAKLARLPALERLDLRGDTRLDDAGLLQFASSPRLQRLDVYGCECATDAAFEALRERRPELVIRGL